MTAIASCCAVTANNANAELHLFDEFYVSGHATLGAVYTDDDDVHFYRDMSQRNSDFDNLTYEADSRFGLRLNYRPHGVVGAELQTFSHYGLSNEFQTNLFAALVRVNIGNDWQIRAGIVPVESFYHADSLHVGFSYPWARPAPEMYNFNIVSNYRGISVQKRFRFDADYLQARLFGGIFGDQISDHPDDEYAGGDSDIYGLGLNYVNGTLTLSFGFTEFRLDDETAYQTKNNLFLYLPDGIELSADLTHFLVDALTENKSLQYTYVGISKDTGPWRFDAAAGTTDGGYLAFNGNYSFFISTGYRIAQWTPYVRVAYVHNDGPSRLAVAMPAVIRDQILASSKQAQANQTNVAIGARFDFAPQAALKIQYNYIRNPDNPTYMWRNEQPEWDGTTNQFSLALDVLF